MIGTDAVERDPLQQLLRDVDELATSVRAPARDPQALASSVRGRHRLRRVVRGAGGGILATAVTIVCLTSWLTTKPRGSTVAERIESPMTTQPADVEHVRALQRQLVAEADVREAAAIRLFEAAERRGRSRTARRTPPPTDLRVDLQREEATLLLLHQGNELARDPALRESAAVAYRQAIDLFPETSGASAAKARLDTLN
jgi:hypothetical protein